MNRYDHYPGDYARDTAGLSLTEHGAYRKLLDSYYSTESPIPDATKFRIAGAATKREKDAVTSVLESFFELKSGRWTHARVEQELDKYRSRIERARANGKLGGRPKQAESGESEETETLSVSETQDEPTDKAKSNPDKSLYGGGGGDLNKIKGKTLCPPGLRLTSDQVTGLEIELIPLWAIEQLQVSLVANWSQDPDQPEKTVANWRKYLAGAIRGRWRDPNKRPRKPANTTTHEGVRLGFGDA